MDYINWSIIYWKWKAVYRQSCGSMYFSCCGTWTDMGKLPHL